MKENFSPKDLEKKIGYRFQDRGMLDAALTRRAYVNEHPDIKECMDPFATVGDAILDSVTTYRLFEGGIRDPGKLTIERSEEVKRSKTRKFAEELHLQKYVLWGEGEKKNEEWIKGDQALDTALEALIGAVFLDAQSHDGNGITVIRKMLERLGYFE
jgi:ribonuclease-3